MSLSNKALNELREVLQKEYGQVFVNSLSEEELDHLGQLFLEIMAQGLKHKVTYSVLPIAVGSTESVMTLK